MNRSERRLPALRYWYHMADHKFLHVTILLGWVHDVGPEVSGLTMKSFTWQYVLRHQRRNVTGMWLSHVGGVRRGAVFLAHFQDLAGGGHLTKSVLGLRWRPTPTCEGRLQSVTQTYSIFLVQPFLHVEDRNVQVNVWIFLPLYGECCSRFRNTFPNYNTYINLLVLIVHPVFGGKGHRSLEFQRNNFTLNCTSQECCPVWYSPQGEMSLACDISFFYFQNTFGWFRVGI